MLYIERKYIIDTNVAATLSRATMKTKIFTEKCFLPEEILYELKDNKIVGHDILYKQNLPTTLEILNKLQSIVMHKAEKVIDLYNNEGNGDVMIVATILAERDKELGQMLLTEWVIVTEDKGLTKLASEFDIRTIGKKEFHSIFNNTEEKKTG
ncbi:hypothetical protein IJF91_02810 [Candidatus Saccharibacteria bacterium]|nr:hypothetical protein [Candidatus Saccharibacteria bacterium]